MRCKKGGELPYMRSLGCLLNTAILLEYKIVYVEIAQRWHAAAQFFLEVNWLSC